MHEWSLLLFTLAMQAAVGGVFVLGVYYMCLKTTLDDDSMFKGFKLSLMVLAGVSIVGLAASLFHLGSPFKAYNAIINVSSSWLSREMLFTGLFVLCLLFTLYLFLKNRRVNLAMILATSLLGLIDIFAMASIYTDTIITSWLNYNTYFSFYGTTFLLGVSLISVTFIPVFKNNAGSFQKILAPTVLIALTSLLVQLIIALVYQTGEVSQLMTIVRWLFASAGVLVILYAFWPKINKEMKVNPGLLYYSFAFILVGEFLGRYLFY